MSRSKANISIADERWLTIEEAMAYTHSCEEHFIKKIRPLLKYVYTIKEKRIEKKITERDKLLYDKNELDMLMVTRFKYKNPYAAI